MLRIEESALFGTMRTGIIDLEEWHFLGISYSVELYHFFFGKDTFKLAPIRKCAHIFI